MNEEKIAFLNQYEILVEKHVRLYPEQSAEYTEILSPGVIVDVDEIIGGWLHLIDGGYVFSGYGKYARPVNHTN